ncbi:MAG TPA: CdaR family protein [Candidatus Babeliales bacterium]|nr:CdaR family protein [Candidatus Babeliales bacterium]
MILKNKVQIPILLIYKIMALICGYGLWVTIAKTQLVQQTIRVPVAFYNLPKNYVVDGPETTKVKISGTRQVLYNLNPADLVTHIDLANTNLGQTNLDPANLNQNSSKITEQEISLINQQLLLPANIRLVEYETDILKLKFKPALKGPSHEPQT